MATASSSSLQAALSPSASMVAVVAPMPESAATLRILVLQTDTGNLQTTLTRRRKEQEEILLPCKILFAGESLLTALFSDRIMVWDLVRGVVAYTLEAKKEQVFRDAAAVDGNLYILVSNKESNKLQVHRFAAESGKLGRKIKAGKGAACGLAVTEEYVIVRHHDSLRVLSLCDGSKVAKLAGLSDVKEFSVVAADEIAATVSSGQIVLVHLPTGKRIENILSNENPSLEMWKASDDMDQDLLFSNGQTVFQISKRSSGDYKIATVSKLTVQTGVEKQAVLGQKEKSAVTAVLFKGGQFQVHQVLLQQSEGRAHIDLTWAEPETEEDPSVKTADSSKRKADNLKVLGPAQAGGEARTASEGPSKKPKSSDENEGDEDDDEGPTIADRLQKLQQALENEEEDNDEEEAHVRQTAFQPKKATTESLSQLLQQALQSGDDSMLELALAVHDSTILQETCQQLPEECLPKLLNALTTRLASKPARAEHLCAWLTILLKTGRIKSISHLQPLRNLLQERLEVFPALLKLEGRLTTMGSL